MFASLLSIIVTLAPNPVELEIRTVYGVTSLEHAQLLFKLADKQLEDIEWYWERSNDPCWFGVWTNAKYKRLVYGELRYAWDRRWGTIWQEHHLTRLQALLNGGPLPSPYVGD